MMYFNGHIIAIKKICSISYIAEQRVSAYSFGEWRSRALINFDGGSNIEVLCTQQEYDAFVAKITE